MNSSSSGGTIASMLNMVDEVKRDRSVLKVLGDPYSLYPKGEARGQDGGDQKGVGRDKDLGMWTGPFVMAAVNAKVVRRSNALLDFAYGREFRYDEAMTTGKGMKGLIGATVVSAGMAAMLPAVAIGPTRRLIERKVPKPGEGPNRAEREAGYFVCRLVGKGVGAGGEPLQLLGRVEGTQDPGYGSTAKMLSQSALCLAFDELDSPGGVLTPASAMGSTLLGRLRDAGMTFSVTE